MSKKLTLTVDADVYDGLHSVIGQRRISRFLNELVRPHVVGQDLSAGYAAMAANEARKAEAASWSNTMLADVADEPQRNAWFRNASRRRLAGIVRSIPGR